MYYDEMSKKFNGYLAYNKRKKAKKCVLAKPLVDEDDVDSTKVD